VGTLVAFHAHPDDECIATGGTIARAVAEGHRVVLVVATDGAHGEIPDDLGPGENLVERRRVETERSAAILGIHRVVWLGFVDSGMTGWPQNEHPASFWQASTDDAATRLAEVLVDESADVLIVYDWHGGYGHPDHVKVHQVGHAAARQAAVGLPGLRVLEVTMNRDLFLRMLAGAGEQGMLDEPADGDEQRFDPDGPADDGNPFGTPEDEISLAVDVSAFVDLKRRAIGCHASQVNDSSMFLSMPPEMFAMAFGVEWYCEPAPPGTKTGGPRPGWVFP
jgi:LmbE family N-acetylglucosaminyl deacetylase